VFGNTSIETLQPPMSQKTALVESRTRLLMVNTKELHASIKSNHADWIAEKQRFLSTSMLFRHWSRKKLYELAPQFVEKTFSAGDRILSQGDQMQGMWILKSGQLRAFRLLQSTKAEAAVDDNHLPLNSVTEAEVELREMWRRDYFGEECLLNHAQGSGEDCAHQQCIAAVAPAVLLFINAADAHKLICPDKVTMKLLKQALPIVPPDEQLLDSLFANQSWSKFKESLQIQLQTSEIENIDIEDSFPTVPAVSCKCSINNCKQRFVDCACTGASQVNSEREAVQ